MIVKSGVFPSKLLSGLFQSTIAVLRVHDCVLRADFELLSGLFELQKINFKAEMHCVSGKKKHNIRFNGTLPRYVGYRKVRNR